MRSNILDGVLVSNKILEHVKKEVEDIKNKYNVTPTLSVINVGENPASKLYISKKQKAAREIGIHSIVHELPENTTSKEVQSLITQLNNDRSIHGILVQLPLPHHIDQYSIMKMIDPKKDVDGFHPQSMGNLVTSRPTFIPATAYGIMEILKYYKIDLKGKNIVIINHSIVLGKPLALLMLKENATVTVCHEYTKNLKSHTKNADILIIGIGKPKFITQDFIKENSIVIDVGISKVEDKIVGDVDFKNVAKKCRYITPVPGGVGPMTVAMLMKTTSEAAKNLLNEGR